MKLTPVPCTILEWLTGLVVRVKPDFHMLGKFQTIKFLPTIADFTDTSDIRQRSVPDSHHLLTEKPCLFVIGGLEPSNLGDW